MIVRSADGTLALRPQTAIVRAEANPARRFALWVFAETTIMTQRKIGASRKYVTSQVAKTFSRLKGKLSPPLDSWVYKWEQSRNG